VAPIAQTVHSAGKALFMNSPMFAESSLGQLTKPKGVDEQSYTDKMKLVLSRYQLNIKGLKDKFDSISSNFDISRGQTKELKSGYNRESILLFEKHTHHLETVDPAQSKKDRKRRELQKLLNDT